MKYVRFTGGNGYCGCDYEEYAAYDDDYDEVLIEQTATELAYENAETYEYVALGWGSQWDSDIDEAEREEYYEDALSYCGWDYCSEEEYLENK